jgi:hypothetical protein
VKLIRKDELHICFWKDFRETLNNADCVEVQLHDSPQYVCSTILSCCFQRGLLRWGKKAIEDFRLLEPQQQKQQLQQQIMQLERQLLALQQAQAQWKAQQ